MPVGNFASWRDCPDCDGTGQEDCRCSGKGRVLVCCNCGDYSPCPGIPEGWFDASCVRLGKEDRRTGSEIYEVDPRFADLREMVRKHRENLAKKGLI